MKQQGKRQGALWKSVAGAASGRWRAAGCLFWALALGVIPAPSHLCAGASHRRRPVRPFGYGGVLACPGALLRALSCPGGGAGAPRTRPFSAFPAPRGGARSGAGTKVGGRSLCRDGETLLPPAARAGKAGRPRQMRSASARSAASCGLRRSSCSRRRPLRCTMFGRLWVSRCSCSSAWCSTVRFRQGRRASGYATSSGCAARTISPPSSCTANTPPSAGCSVLRRRSDGGFCAEFSSARRSNARAGAQAAGGRDAAAASLCRLCRGGGAAPSASAACRGHHARGVHVRLLCGGWVADGLPRCIRCRVFRFREPKKAGLLR